MNKVCLKCIILDLCRQYIITQSRAHVKTLPSIGPRSHNEKIAKMTNASIFQVKIMKDDFFHRERPDSGQTRCSESEVPMTCEVLIIGTLELKAF